MVDIIFELPFIDDVIDLLSDTLDPPIISQLSNDELVEFALSKLHILVYGLLALLNDIFQSQRTKLHPFVFDDPQCDTRLPFFQGTRVTCEYLLLL